MPNRAFRGALRSALSRGRTTGHLTVVLGVGSELRGDDAAGMRVAELLARMHLEGVHALQGGSAPENSISLIRRLAPSHLVIVDSADMGLAAGALRVLDPTDIDAASPGTHAFPLSLFVRYVSLEIGCAVTVIGIQPRGLAFGAGLSREVEEAIAETVDALAECLRPRDDAPGR
jgi:hydrogenase 3 maturation protease